MPKPKELTESPTFHETWKAAKKAAEKTAKAAKKSSAFDGMMAEMGKLNFGPELDKWPELYPDWGKMEAQRLKIGEISGKYKKAVNDQLKLSAMKRSDLPKEVAAKLLKTLEEIENGLNAHAALAKSSIESDPKLGAKLSTEMAKSKGILTPIVVLQHPDISKLVRDRLGDDAKIIAPKKLPIEVILSDASLLKKMTETPDLRAKVAEAANFEQLLLDITKVYADAAAAIKKDPKKAEEQKALVQKRTEQAVQMATTRGAEELARITSVRTDYTKYQIKCAAEIFLAVGGLVTGTITLAAGPFTAGASVIVGCVVLVKGAVELGTKLGKLSLEAEEFAGRLAARLSTLLTRYDDASKANVGWREMGMTAVNSIFSTTFKSIGECSGDIGQLGDKINGLEKTSGDVSGKLNDQLLKQDDYQKGLKAWEQNNASVLTPVQVKAIEKLIKSLDANAEKVDELLKSVIAYNARVKKMRNAHSTLDTLFKQLSAKEPNWAKFGEVAVKIIIGVGFTVAGTSVVPGPDAFKCAELAKKIAENANTTLGAIGNAKDAYEGVKGLINA